MEPQQTIFMTYAFRAFAITDKTACIRRMLAPI
jgi:hypothetical protein